MNLRYTKAFTLYLEVCQSSNRKQVIQLNKVMEKYNTGTISTGVSRMLVERDDQALWDSNSRETL
jgi:hypothetical protein